MFSLENYKTVFEDSSILTAFGVTVLRTLVGTVLNVFFTAMVAYGLSKTRLIGRNFYLTMGIITMMFNGGLIPTFLLYKNLNLLDNFLVFVIPAMFSFYNAIIFMSFFREIPASLEESAENRRSQRLPYFLRIILPLSKPVLATIALFSGVYHWNDYFSGVIYINKPSLQPIQTYLYRMVAEAGSNQMAAQTADGKIHHLHVSEAGYHGSHHVAYCLCLSLPAEIFRQGYDDRRSKRINLNQRRIAMRKTKNGWPRCSLQLCWSVQPPAAALPPPAALPRAQRAVPLLLPPYPRTGRNPARQTCPTPSLAGSSMPTSRSPPAVVRELSPGSRENGEGSKATEKYTKDTGINVELIIPAGNEAEKLNTMIASDTLPDLITLGCTDTQVAEMIDAEMVLPLNKLADEHDPYFYKVANQERLDWYTQDDGNVYGYPNALLFLQRL